LEKKKGLCYDRSLILQKIFIYSGIPIRPVYVYWSATGTDVSVFNLLDKNLNSHNLFEYNLSGKWYLMETSTVLSRSITLDKYLDEGKLATKNCQYIRYLNNRNGKFIYPSFIPDVYYF